MNQNRSSRKIASSPSYVPVIQLFSRTPPPLPPKKVESTPLPLSITCSIARKLSFDRKRAVIDFLNFNHFSCRFLTCKVLPHGSFPRRRPQSEDGFFTGIKSIALHKRGYRKHFPRDSYVSEISRVLNNSDRRDKSNSTLDDTTRPHCSCICVHDTAACAESVTVNRIISFEPVELVNCWTPGFVIVFRWPRRHGVSSISLQPLDDLPPEPETPGETRIDGRRLLLRVVVVECSEHSKTQ